MGNFIRRKELTIEIWVRCTFGKSFVQMVGSQHWGILMVMFMGFEIKAPKKQLWYSTVEVVSSRSYALQFWKILHA